jgi:hypothetical protein
VAVTIDRKSFDAALAKFAEANMAMGHYGTWAPDDDTPHNESEASDAIGAAEEELRDICGVPWP